jgi:hypothetical protein
MCEETGRIFLLVILPLPSEEPSYHSKVRLIDREIIAFSNVRDTYTLHSRREVFWEDDQKVAYLCGSETVCAHRRLNI